MLHFMCNDVKDQMVLAANWEQAGGEEGGANGLRHVSGLESAHSVEGNFAPREPAGPVRPPWPRSNLG